MIVNIDKFPPFKQVMEPYKHQNDCFLETRDLPYYALFWEMGTGKTKPLIDTIAWLFLNRQIDGVLIISDKGAYLNWELAEFPKHLPPELMEHTRIARWAAHLKKEDARNLDRLCTALDDTLDIVSMNVESLSTERAFATARRFVEAHYTLIIVDEATSIKNPTAKRTINIQILGRLADYRRIATGTPIANGPMDLYAMAHFLEPGLLGHRSFTSYRAQYAVMREMILGTRRFKVIAGYQNLDHLTEKMRGWSSRILKEECLDLPDRVFEVEHVEMSPEQRHAYDTLKNEALITLNEGMLTSTNAMTTVEKLHQICCGHARDDDGNLHLIPNNRIDTFKDIVERARNKFLVWCNYQVDVELVMAALEELWKDTDYYAVHYYGKTTQDLRTTHLQKFADDPNCRAFVGTESTGGKGLTLTQADLSIYYSTGWNLEKRLQSQDRNHRIGQTQKVTYIDLCCPGTVEARILKSHKDKTELASEILDTDRLRELLS
jgi:SNF2 family DNA or RNA helicase